MSDQLVTEYVFAKNSLSAAERHAEDVAEAKKLVDRNIIVLLLCIIGLIGIAAYQLDGVRKANGLGHSDRVQMDRLVSSSY